MNVIDSNSLERDAGGKALTLFLIPLWRTHFRGFCVSLLLQCGINLVAVRAAPKLLSR
jgi:hypothetical protein